MAVASDAVELTSAAAVRALPPEEAARGLPVRLRGNLLLETQVINALVLYDGEEGIYVVSNQPAETDWQPGDELEVVGVTDSGDFAPIVRAREVVRRGPGVLPPARLARIADLDAGGYDAAWVELRGIVRSCEPAPPPRPVAVRARGRESESPPGLRPGPARETWLLVLGQGNDRMTVQVNDRMVPGQLVDAEVRLRAVVFNVHNANRQFVRATLQVSDAAMVEVLVPPPPDPFALPFLPIGEVLRFTRTGFTGHRVHVRGVVTAHDSGRSFWVRDGERGMRIDSTQPDKLRPGDQVDIVGFPNHGSYTPSISNAIFRKVASGPPPLPQPLRPTEDTSPHESNLVQLYADLLEVRDTPEGLQLSLDWGGRRVFARMLQPVSDENRAAWLPGSHVRVDGICLVAPTEPFSQGGLWLAQDIQVLLRTPQDLTIMRPAPWLTTPRLLGLVIGGLLVALVALTIVAVLTRREVAQREESRKLAEVEFAAMLAERNRLAREIHDTVAQDLNAVSMQLELARNAAAAGEQGGAGRYLAIAHQLVRKCLAEARESIWDMRSHILERSDLARALETVARQLMAGQACEVRTRVTGRARRLAPVIENNLLRIGQEAVSNALKHAAPSRLEITLDYGEDRVRLAVRDDGPGIDPAAADPNRAHFGLKGLQERVAQINGELRIGRDPAGGTRVEVEVGTPAPV